MPAISAPDHSLTLSRFSSAAENYDHYAVHHRMIAEDLLDLIKDIHPERILELGCGTGILSQRLNWLFPSAVKVFTDGASGMVKVCCDKVPPSFLVQHTIWDFEYSDCSSTYDLVASSCALQWLCHREGFFQKLKKIVAPGGATAHAIPVVGMLPEFQESFHAAGEEWTSLGYLSPEMWIELFHLNGFTVQESFTDTYSVSYPSPADALRALNGIGASLSGHDGIPGTKPSELRKALRFYRDRFETPYGDVPSSYRVLFLKAVRD